MTTPDISRVKAVFEQHSMYDAVVQHNYMHHKELAAALDEWAKAFDRPLKIVDLGCGDAGLATAAFRSAEVRSYLGVELAEASAELGRQNLKTWPGRAEIRCGNLAEALAGLPDASTNFVLASYSLHHFSTSDKLNLVDEIHRLLEPGGAFVWIDAVRDDGETRDAYIERITHVIAENWTSLTLEQRQHGVEHIRASDFPETKSWMLANVEAAGFRPSGSLLRDEFFDGWVLTKE